MEETKSYGSIKLSQLKKAIAQIESVSKGENIDITFEYLIGSFFPEVVKNVHEEAKKQYTKGYAQGYKEGKNENKGSN